MRTAILLFALVVPGVVQAQHSTTGPIPPPGLDQGMREPSRFQVLIPDVPTYEWHHGCGPTALGMVIGYYDGKGFPDLVPGSAQTQTAEVNAVIADDGGHPNCSLPDGDHYQDYSCPMDQSGPIEPDRSELGGAHESNCLADFMRTSWSIDYMRYGWSYNSNVPISFVEYVSYATVYVATSSTRWFNEFSWEEYRAEIDAGRPVGLLVDTDGDNSTDHFITAVGYDEAANEYACHNTWDHSVHWYDWSAMAGGNLWGIALITTFLFDEPVSACCIGDQCEQLTFSNCVGAGGTWLVGIDSCDPNPCVETYACCVGGDMCQLFTLEECLVAGGDWLAGIDSCDPNPCFQYACCQEMQCVMLGHQDCMGVGGDWLVGVDSCDPNPCIPSACCFDTSCEVLREQDCVHAGGEWKNDIETCDPNPCVPYACCIGEICEILTDEECVAVDGEWRIGVPTCEPNPCFSFVVRADGTGDYPTIQAAIDAASSGQVIDLADGVFMGDGNRDVNYGGKDVVVRSESGDPSTCIIDCQGSPTDQHRGFEFESGETASAVLEGVAIINGYMTSYSGGGISCNNDSSPTITNCVLRNNYAGPSGGGFYIRDSQPGISYCTIDHNESDNGGGIRLQSVPSLTIRNCTISDNTAIEHAGGVFSFGSALTLENCIVSFSAAGEAFYCYYSDVDLFCCDVFGNADGDWSGCIEGQDELNGNICEDPRFCDADSGNYFLDVSSSCAPFAPPNEECDLIGACPVGCELQGLDDNPLFVRMPHLDPGTPNPFGRSTVVTYSIPGAVEAGFVDLSIFDPAGRLVCTLADGLRSPGTYSVTWDGKNQRGGSVAAGVYLCKLSFQGRQLTRRIVLVR